MWDAQNLRSTIGVALLITAGVTGQTVNDLFDDSVLQEIRIEMTAADWRTLHDNYLANTWYPCKVQWRDIQLDNVSIRSRGTGSRNPIKPALALDFTRRIPSQRLATVKTLILRNFAQDPSMLHERLTEKMFARMGLPHSREAHAKVFVNDEYVGLYMMVEPIDDRFLSSRFGENSGALYEFNWTGTPYNFEYLGGDPAAYIPGMFEPKTSTDDQDSAVLVDMIRTINEAADDEFVSSVRKYLDLDTFIVHVAVEQFMSEWDGIFGFAGMTNFYLYRRASDHLFVFLVWDKDNTFSSVDRSIWENAANNVLMRRAMMTRDLRERYLSTLLQAAMSAGVSGGWLETEAIRAYTQIHDAARLDPYRVCPNGLDFIQCSFDAFEAANNAVQQFSATRSERVRSEVTAAEFTGPILEPEAATLTGGLEHVISPGSLAEVKVPWLLSEEAATSFPLPLEMQGIKVTIGGNVAPALACRNQTLIVQVPWDTICGPQTLSVERQGGWKAATSVEVRPNYPSIIAVADTDWHVINSDRPAVPGSILVVFATGFTQPEYPQPTGGPPSGELVELAASVTATLDGIPARVLFAGLAPGLAGVEQLTLQLPLNITNRSAVLVLVVNDEPGTPYLLPVF